MFAFDDALALRPRDDGSWNGFADPRFDGVGSMFGGWTAALLLKGAMDHPQRQGSPAAITVSYLKPLRAGTELELRAMRLGGSRSLIHWRAELYAADEAEPAASASITFANRRESDGFTEPTAPQAAPPETLPESHPPARHGEQVVLRPATGGAIFNQVSSRSVHWVRDIFGRSMDLLLLTALCDVYAPRIYFKSADRRLSSTITLTVYYFALDDELRAVGSDYILTEAIGTRAAASIIGQQARLWSRSGSLLATTQQLCWFK